MVDVSAVRYNLSTRESEGVANHTLHVMHALTVVSVVNVGMYLISELPTDLIKGAGNTTGPVLAVCLQPLALYWKASNECYRGCIQAKAALTGCVYSWYSHFPSNQ